MTAIGRLRGVLLLALVLALTGCKKPKPTQAEADEGPSREAIQRGLGKTFPVVGRTVALAHLTTIAQLYGFYRDAHGGASPKKLEDLKDLDAQTVRAVKEGEYVVVWDAPRNALQNTVIAYEKDAPTQGGVVANLGGTATSMTPEEFKAAPKVTGH
jgi:hypothetical protein